ncbi:MAG: DUF6314 family protein [Sulfitobacter sp.]
MAARARELADFEGAWQFARAVCHADGLRVRVRGTAAFTWDGAALRYEERGQMRMAGRPAMQVVQRYVWQADLAVHFADGRYFHHVPVRGGPAAHFCAPDAYQVDYGFSRWPRWRTLWRVRGPAKDYTMLTGYWRVNPPIP